MRQGAYRQIGNQPRPSQFRNLRSSDFYDSGRYQGYESPRRQDYMTTPSYSVHDIDQDGYPESRVVEIDRVERIPRREQYQSPSGRINNTGHTVSLSNLSRDALHEDSDSRYATLPADLMKKDSARNIEINLNFEKGKVSMGDQFDKIEEYEMVMRSYEKDRLKWDTDRKAFKNELNQQHGEIDKLQSLVMSLRNKIRNQEELTNELLAGNERTRRLSSPEPDMRELRTVRSLTKVHTARESLRDSFGEDQRNQLRDIEEKTRQLKEMERQERMTAEELMAIVKRLREENTNYRRIHYEMQRQSPSQTSRQAALVTSEAQTDNQLETSRRFSELPRRSESDRLENNIIKEQNERLLRDAERLNGEVNNLLNENNRLNKENIRLRTEMSDLRTAHKSEVEKLSVDVNNLADMLVEKEMENDQLSRYREQVGELTRLNDELNQSIREMSPAQPEEAGIIGELRRQIEGLLQEISSLEAEKMSVIKSARDLNDENQRLKQTNQEVEVAYETLERDFKQLSSKFEIAKMSLKEFEIQNAELKQQLADYGHQLADDRTELRDYEQSKQKVWELSEEISRLEKQLKIVGSELQLSNSLSLELRLLNETLQQQLNAKDRAESRDRQSPQLVSLNGDIEKIKEEISRIQKHHKVDVSEKSEHIKMLEDNLKRSTEQLARLQTEKEKAVADASTKQVEIEVTRSQVLSLRQTLSKLQQQSGQTSTEKKRDLDEDNLLHLTEQLEKSLADVENMKATMQSMQNEIEQQRKEGDQLLEEKRKLEIALADGATKHERELKAMLGANEQIVRNLLEIAQKNYELEGQIAQMKTDVDSFLKVESNVKENEQVSSSEESSIRIKKLELASNLQNIAEESEEDSKSFQAVSKVKSLLCDMESMFQEEGAITCSGELLDSIDRLEKMIANRSRVQKPASFTKKEPFYDNEISGFSMMEADKKNSSFKQSELSEEREKLGRLSDSKALYEVKLDELLSESQLKTTDSLTTVVYAFVKKLYQHPNLNFLYEEILRFFGDIKAYEEHVEEKIKSMECAVQSYLEKANGLLAIERIAKSEDTLPSGLSNIPSVSEFKFSPSENVGLSKHLQLPQIIEENRMESGIEGPITPLESGRSSEPPNEQKLDPLDEEQLLDEPIPIREEAIALQSEQKVPLRKGLMRTPSQVSEASGKKSQQADSNSKTKPTSKSMNMQRFAGTRSPGIKINAATEREIQKSTPTQSPLSPKTTASRKETDQKTKPKPTVSTPTSNRRPPPKK